METDKKIMDVKDVLERLRKEDPEFRSILDLYGETERIYHETLEAMGRGRPAEKVANSAEVRVTFPERGWTFRP